MSASGNLSLVGGVLAFDFTNTAGGRDTADAVEHLRSATHLVEWAAHAGGIDTETAERSCAAVAGDDDAARKLLRQALQLREAIYGIGSAIARTAAPRPTDLRVLRDFAHKAIGSADLAPVAGGGYGFDFSAAPPEFALLGPVAWSALDLLATGNFERVKQCPSPDCGWLFLDSSKNNSRRWCDMASCGNRMKVRKHRERR